MIENAIWKLTRLEAFTHTHTLTHSQTHSHTHTHRHPPHTHTHLKDFNWIYTENYAHPEFISCQIKCQVTGLGYFPLSC